MDWFLWFVLTPLWVALFAAFYLQVGRRTVRLWRLRHAGATATGRVISVQQERGIYLQPRTIGTVRYLTRRGRYTVTDQAGSDLEVGQKCQVRYLPTDPQVAVISDSTKTAELVLGTVATILVTAILAGIAFSGGPGR